MPYDFEKEKGCKALERMEEAKRRAEFFAKGGVIKRYPCGVRSADWTALQSGWGRNALRTRLFKEKKKSD